MHQERAGSIGESSGFRFAHPRCYAAELNDCSTTISGEHAISAAMLELFASDGVVSLAGLTSMSDDERQALPVKAFTSNVLRTSHNS